MDYLTLVNNAIMEAGVDLDDLTSTNFANPPSTKMYKRFKKWVKDAYEDIQLEANDWEFENATAVVQISPIIVIKNGNRFAEPPADSTFETGNGATFTMDSVSLISGDWTAGTALATMTISNISGAFELLDTITEVTPVADALTANFRYFGRYNITDYVSDLKELKKETMKVQVPNGQMRDLVYIPWPQWEQNHEADQSRGLPLFYTETPEGYFDFYPRPDQEYTISFEYVKGLDALTNYNDEPTLIKERYHPAIYWRAVMYYANYDKDGALWNTAKKRHDFYMFTYDRDLGQTPSWGQNKFDE